MRFIPALLLLLALFAFMNAGCSNSGGMTPTINPAEVRTADYVPDEFCGEATEVILLAGKNTEVGTVTVYNDENCLYVHYDVNAPWVITETHVAVSDTFAGLPQTKTGNPKVGNFPYEMDECIDLNQWPIGTELFIAAHAVVEMYGEGGELIKGETAWGKGDPFNVKGSWAMYFKYTTQNCCLELDLPEDMITFNLSWGTDSYIINNMWDVPDGYWIDDGSYPAWCTDKYHYIYLGTVYQAYVYNSYAPETWPDDERLDNPWDKINWIFNNRDGYSKDQVQAAIWWFTDQVAYSDPGVAQLVADADMYGAGFTPGADDTMAIIIYVMDPTVQITIVQIPTQCE
jgi:hypothetical protein